MHGEDIITSLCLSRCVVLRFVWVVCLTQKSAGQKGSEEDGGEGRGGERGFSASNSPVTASRQLFIYLIFNFI